MEAVRGNTIPLGPWVVVRHLKGLSKSRQFCQFKNLVLGQAPQAIIALRLDAVSSRQGTEGWKNQAVA